MSVARPRYPVCVYASLTWTFVPHGEKEKRESGQGREKKAVYKGNRRKGTKRKAVRANVNENEVQTTVPRGLRSGRN